MTSGNFLGFAALAVLLGGLLAVLLEAAVKSPSTALDLLTRGLPVAKPEPLATPAGGSPSAISRPRRRPTARTASPPDLASWLLRPASFIEAGEEPGGTPPNRGNSAQS